MVKLHDNGGGLFLNLNPLLCIVFNSICSIVLKSCWWWKPLLPPVQALDNNGKRQSILPSQFHKLFVKEAIQVGVKKIPNYAYLMKCWDNWINIHA